MYYGAYEDEVPLDSLIEGAVEEFEQAREQYFHGQGEKGEKFLRFVDAVAKLLFLSTYELTRPEEVLHGFVEWDIARKAAQVEAVKEFVTEALQISLARRFYRGTDHMAERAYELAELALDHQPNLQVIRFLQRLSRCYVAGFDPECVMLCRTVLEASLDEAYENHRIERPSRLVDKIKAAPWLGPELKTAARTIRTRGNTAVHKDPTVTGEALDTVRLTMEVLEHLYGGSSDRHGA